MNREKQLDAIKRLSDANGASGFEEAVADEIRRQGGELGAWRRDSMCNLLLEREGNRGGRPSVLLDAHTDEVGFMVQSILPNGLLKFLPLGGWTPANLPAQRVRVRTQSGGYVPGVIASKPPHFTTEAERKAAPGIDTMLIDVGACSRSEAEAVFGIRIGEPVVPEAQFTYIEANGTLLGKAFDNRLGCAALLATLKDLQGQELPLDVTAAFTSQEELGTRGARVVANGLQPDIAIVFEGAPADDTFAAEPQCALKKGPMLRHMDATILTNPRLMRHVLCLAGQNGIPVQQAVRGGGGTNAAVLHLAGKGVPVVVLGIPVRYIHAHYGIAALEDYEATVRLAALLIQSLSVDVLQAL